jgi:hypothetical protein
MTTQSLDLPQLNVVMPVSGMDYGVMGHGECPQWSSWLFLDPLLVLWLYCFWIILRQQGQPPDFVRRIIENNLEHSVLCSGQGCLSIVKKAGVSIGISRMTYQLQTDFKKEKERSTCCSASTVFSLWESWHFYHWWLSYTPLRGPQSTYFGEGRAKPKMSK